MTDALLQKVAFALDAAHAHGFSEAPPKPSARTPQLGTRFDAIVARAMSKRPADGYATAGELGAADLAAVAHPTPTHHPRVRRDALVAALTDPVNVVLFGVLLVAGALLGTVRPMVLLALAVDAAGVWRAYHDV